MQKPSVSGYDRKYDQYIPDPSSGGGTVVWQPGTGTRYVLVARPMSGPEAAQIGCGAGDLLVCLLLHPGWVALPLQDGACHHISYVGEKLRGHGVTSEEEISAAAALLNLALGDVAYGEELYRELMGARGGR